jgi:hypothetical protein
MNISSFFVANSQSTELVEPRETPLDDPAPSAEPLPSEFWLP